MLWSWNEIIVLTAYFSPLNHPNSHAHIQRNASSDAPGAFIIIITISIIIIIPRIFVSSLFLPFQKRDSAAGLLSMPSFFYEFFVLYLYRRRM